MEAAYAFEKFAPRENLAPKTRPVLQVAPGKLFFAKKRMHHRLQVLGWVLCVISILALVVMLLYTQSSIAALQAQITQQNKELVDQQALHVYLAYELESKTNMRGIEERAIQLGMVKMDQTQIAYIQKTQENQISLQERGVEKMIRTAQVGVMDLVDHVGG